MRVDDKLYKIIGTSIAARRKELAMTQDDLADAVGLLRTSVTNIEAGRQRAPLALLFKLCMQLGIELGSILPTNKQVVENHTVSFDVDGTRADLAVSGSRGDFSEETLKNIQRLIKKI